VIVRRAVRYLDSRTGTGPGLRRALRYVFPDHWSFYLGEIALFAYVVLVATGIWLTFYFEPTLALDVYAGDYLPLRGQEVSGAYRSVLDLSFDVPAGLLMRQTHHWAALVFVAATTLHLMRIFFTGAFRRPRELNYYTGLALLVLSLGAGFTGYSLADDLLSGMGLAIAYSTAMSLPLIGPNVALLVWGGEFPGAEEFLSRLYVLHIFLIPAAITTLIAVHTWLITRPKHTQFPGPGRTERTVTGSPAWPGYALRATGMFLATASVLVLMGGLIQINPVWLYGPYEPWEGTNGAQPDWYLGWLIGALRLMPAWEPSIFGFTLVPNPFFGGVLFPSIVFGFLALWPWIERRVTGDRAEHHLLDRPRDNPWRTAVGLAMVSWVAIIFLAGSADRLWVLLGVTYETQIVFFRVLAVVGPFLVYWLARRVCEELKRSEIRPYSGFTGRTVAPAPEEDR
jgi:ubiquinol-cytochrome c reductase cytochrome b subunit